MSKALEWVAIVGVLAFSMLTIGAGVQMLTRGALPATWPLYISDIILLVVVIALLFKIENLERRVDGISRRLDVNR